MSKKTISISDSEWKVMKVLWKKPKLTLRQIFENLTDTDWSYTTVRTLVTRLSDKGAILADKSEAKNFKYSPAVSESECKTKEVKNFIAKVFDGSASLLISNMAKESNLSEDEQKKLMELIEKM